MSETRNLGTGTGTVATLLSMFLDVTGTYDDTRVTVPAVQNSNSLGYRQVMALASGENTISIPSGSTGVVFWAPTGNTVALGLKVDSASTALPLNPNGVTVLSLATTGAPATSFLLVAGGAVTRMTFLWL